MPRLPPTPCSARFPSPAAQGRRCTPIAALLLTACFATPAFADSAQPSGPALDPSIGRVEVTLDLPKDKPYVGEMILLRMRSFIHADVVLDRIEQPPLLNFSWQQLGRDQPVEAMIDGFRVAGVERDLAIFPTTSGRLIIEPFTRHVTIVTADNQRVEADFTSKPVYVDIQNYTAMIPPDSWWLPAASLSLTETWSQQPDEIKPGTLARRTITVEALGLTGDRLPPPPTMEVPGTIAFRGPVTRETILSEEGPIARGTYVWDLRPVSASPAKMPAVHVAWFDTRTRRLRDSALPEQWVALVGTLVHPSHEARRRVGLLSAGPLAVGAAGFVWTAALVGFALTGRRPLGRRARRRARALAGLRVQARIGDRTDDGAGFSRALVDLARSDPARWREVSAEPLVAGRLRALDRARYGRIVPASQASPQALPPLAPLASDLRRLWVEHAEAGPSDDGLPPIDGELAPRRSTLDRLRRRG